MRRRKGKRKTSLVDCEPYVLKCFDMFRERQVGGRQNKKKRDFQRRQVEKEVKRFLSAIPQDVLYLKRPFLNAMESLKAEDIRDDGFDELETIVEDLLYRNAEKKDIKQAEESVVKEHTRVKGEERQGLIRIKLIKHMREKHKIPHLSLFYY